MVMNARVSTPAAPHSNFEAVDLRLPEIISFRAFEMSARITFISRSPEIILSGAEDALHDIIPYARACLQEIVQEIKETRCFHA